MPSLICEYVPLVTDPAWTPETSVDAAIVKDVVLFAVTLLNVSSPEAVWYLIISPTLIPVNTFPGLTNVLPPLIVPPTTPLGRFSDSNAESAVNIGKPEIPDWEADLISLVPYETTDATVAEASIPLMINCSPTENVPEVCLILTVLPEPEETAYPLAPLLFPLI